MQREQLAGWCASGLIEGSLRQAGRRPRGRLLAGCSGRSSHQAHRLRLGCSTSRPVGEAGGWRKTCSPAQADFLNQASKRGGRLEETLGLLKAAAPGFPFHGPRRPRAFVKVWSLDRRTSKIHSTSADVGSYIYICSELGRKRCQAHTRNRAGGKEAPISWGTSQVPGKKTWVRKTEGGLPSLGTRGQGSRQTTGMGKGFCPRNGAHPDQKVGGEESGEGVRADNLGAKERGKKRKACWGGGMDLLQV